MRPALVARCAAAHGRAPGGAPARRPPEHLREHGYYVLPCLDGDSLRARVDLKAARETSTLLVQAVYLEPGSDVSTTAAQLAAELREVARWLGLEHISVTRKGSLASALRRCI